MKDSCAFRVRNHAWALLIKVFIFLVSTIHRHNRRITPTGRRRKMRLQHVLVLINYHPQWGGGETISSHSLPEPIRIVPHPRTMRKAREQIKQMVHDGFSIQSIRRYLHRFVLWWVNTSDTWTYEELLILYQETCWDKRLATFALDLLKQHAVKKSYTTTVMSNCRCP